MNPISFSICDDYYRNDEIEIVILDDDVEAVVDIAHHLVCWFFHHFVEVDYCCKDEDEPLQMHKDESMNNMDQSHDIVVAAVVVDKDDKKENNFENDYHIHLGLGFADNNLKMIHF